MISGDFHVHTCFCDGSCTPEEAVLAAIEKGLKKIGLVAHSYVPFDSCCISPENVPVFQSEIKRIAEKYRDKISVYCGVEADFYSEQQLDGFDYLIGSAHYLRCGGEYPSIDDTPEILRRTVEKFYGGDFYSCAEDYFNTVARWADRGADMIGHFDLIKKFSQKIPFDDQNPRYKAAWRSAADKIISADIPFEINLGGISRGVQSAPYPSFEIIDYIASKGGSFVLSSDAHSPENIAYEFEKFSYLIKNN